MPIATLQYDNGVFGTVPRPVSFSAIDVDDAVVVRASLACSGTNSRFPSVSATRY